MYSIMFLLLKNKQEFKLEKGGKTETRQDICKTRILINSCTYFPSLPKTWHTPTGHCSYLQEVISVRLGLDELCGAAEYNDG